MRGVVISSHRYEITLTDVKSGIQITVNLSSDHKKWVVKADGYQGYFKSLDVAIKEAFAHIQAKLGEKGEQ